MPLLVCPRVTRTILPVITLLYHDDTEDISRDPQSQC